MKYGYFDDLYPFIAEHLMQRYRDAGSIDVEGRPRFLTTRPLQPGEGQLYHVLGMTSAGVRLPAGGFWRADGKRIVFASNR